MLPCTGKIDALLVLQAFENGADGVMVAGCLPGDCHYLEGNTNAKRRIERIKTLVANIGLEPERVQMFNLSSAMATRFVDITKEMMEKTAELGPSPLRR